MAKQTPVRAQTWCATHNSIQLAKQTLKYHFPYHFRSFARIKTRFPLWETLLPPSDAGRVTGQCSMLGITVSITPGPSSLLQITAAFLRCKFILLLFGFFPPSTFNFFFHRQGRGNGCVKQGMHPTLGPCQQAGKRAQESSEKSKKNPKISPAGTADPVP